MSDLKRTVYYQTHVEAGATLVDFGGWEMPIQYPIGIISEHLACRKNCAIFDVSHMGRVYVEGSQRVEFLQHVLSSNVGALEMNKAQYTIIPTTTGGAVDDAYLYRFAEDHYFLVVNASNTDKDLAHFAEIVKDFDCRVTNITGDCASIAIQGPESEELLKKFAGVDELTAYRKATMSGKIAAFAGASGVGKSSLLARLFPERGIETGEISRKIERGKNTTRHVELFEYECDGGIGYIADTPGFSLLDFVRFDFFTKEDLPTAMREFRTHLGDCRYKKCTHTKEEGCAILDAVKRGEIAPSRHASFLEMYDALKDKREWKKG